IRDDEDAARSLGVRVAARKRLLFVLAGFGCGAAGVLVVANTLFIEPSSVFSVRWSAYMIFMVLVGGLGTFDGPILGAILLFAIQTTFTQGGPWYLVGLGATAALFALALPRGLWGTIEERLGLRLLPVGYRVVEARRDETDALRAAARRPDDPSRSPPAPRRAGNETPVGRRGLAHHHLPAVRGRQRAVRRAEPRPAHPRPAHLAGSLDDGRGRRSAQRARPDPHAARHPRRPAQDDHAHDQRAACGAAADPPHARHDRAFGWSAGRPATRRAVAFADRGRAG